MWVYTLRGLRCPGACIIQGASMSLGSTDHRLRLYKKKSLTFLSSISQDFRNLNT